MFQQLQHLNIYTLEKRENMGSRMSGYSDNTSVDTGWAWMVLLGKYICTEDLWYTAT